METAGIVVLLFLLIFAALATVATVRTVRAVKRGVTRGTAQARRVVEDAQLKARRYTSPGVAGDVVQLRIDLRTAIDSTFAALDERHPDDAALAEAAALMARLNDHARALDGELKLLEREPDKSRVAARLPELATRVHHVTHSADSLRWAAQDRAHHATADDLASLTDQIAIESDALRHWTPTQPPKLPASGE
ncbi:hypothetical protein NMG29_07580 [Streptomyces cocklensis]|uniref:Secreted protein n=1 Tax=Actinacidiphila cocklensis TaxID=887465 RepID=A0A9W4GQ79_9ACTN|nr:hypothetical protein [Actinacidiphila cocklensis]MDD1058089.1 hypothetical protein [Actinacidiphila cocklensis]WSX79474.1 hypothetical protein OH826_39895 [Streptomyces sp. NBC_00899]CAG6393118.1 conserved hypothetical protein [Actinacidiphila cocklensis]